MEVYKSFQKALKPYVGQFTRESYENVYQLTKKQKQVLECVSMYYDTCTEHYQFLQNVLVGVRDTLNKYGVEYSEKGIASAKERLMPLVEKFKEQKELTGKVSHAILYLIYGYIHDSPFNTGVSISDTPTLAVMSINVFLVTFVSTIVTMSVAYKQTKKMGLVD